MAPSTILNTKFSQDWLENVILTSKAVKSRFEIDKIPENTKILSLSQSNGKVAVGYVADVLLVDLKWSIDDKRLPNSVALKIPIPNDREFRRTVHNIECSFYDSFDGVVEGLKVPTCYHTAPLAIPADPIIDDLAIIVLDTIKGAEHMDVCKGFSVQQVREFINTMVKLHAYCLVNPEWPSKLATRFEKPEQLMDLQNACQTLVNRLRTNHPGRFDESYDKLNKYLHPEYLAKVIVETHKKLDRPPVVCHGDVWTNNIFYDSSDVSKLVSIVDWQIIHTGVPIEGLGHMMARGMSYSERRKHENELIEYYHKRLDTEMLKLATPNPYSLDDLRLSYKLVQPNTLNGLLVSVACQTDWNRANMSDDDVEDMLRNVDEYLIDVIALVDSGVL